MKAATILALLLGTNAIRLTDEPSKKHTFPVASKILGINPDTEFPDDYPAGSIKQLDDGICRSSDCGHKTQDKKEKKVDGSGSDKKVNAKPKKDEADATKASVKKSEKPDDGESEGAAKMKVFEEEMHATNVTGEDTCLEKFKEAQRLEGNWHKETKAGIDIMHWCPTDGECKEWIKDKPLKHIEECFRDGKLKM